LQAEKKCCLNHASACRFGLTRTMAANLLTL
jgi:hypothetical protein